MAGNTCKYCHQPVRWSGSAQALVDPSGNKTCPSSPSKAHST